MGWKTSMIIINSEEEFDKDSFFESVGYYNLKESKDQVYDEIMNPDDDKICIGKYNGNTIVCMQELPLESMNESLSKAETILSNKFQNTDIVTFVLHSVINLWGYSIVRNGKKIRVRFGNSEEGTILEYGEILEEEKELFSQSKINNDGERVFLFDGLPEDEEFVDDQVGENFIFDISSKYLGESLDECEELFETKFETYTFNKIKPKSPWWKFW